MRSPLTPEMPGTVNALVPLSLLEAVRSIDTPEGDDVEYVQEHRNKRLGLSDTVIAQIRRYKDAMKRGQEIVVPEAMGISKLIGRRDDADGIFVRGGTGVAAKMYELIPFSRRKLIHILPGFAGRPLAFNQLQAVTLRYLGGTITKAGSSLVLSVTESVTQGSAPRSLGCTYYESALREMLKLLVSGSGMVDHARCLDRGDGVCEWRAEWRTSKVRG
ncbi:MAG TPA: hypothetical protein VNJ04_15040 [Gemmatimonadaceae bacterium]|nr:hypothetical protein [Gemmatimonadaceae bacterium]